MTSLQPHLSTLFSYLPPRPSSQEKIERVVRETLVKVGHATPGEGPIPKGPSSDIRSQWEMVLRGDIYQVITTEGRALKDSNTTFYDEICERLDVIVAFTELDITDQTFPFQILQDLFESLTIPSCAHIFTYLESRSAVLTANMIPQKGKALVLLRTLNDLLRRLSKTGDRTILCGRILNFLSGVFPLGERSGVNLRGEYGPVWEGVKDPREQNPSEDEEMKDASDANAMEVDSPTKKLLPPDPKAELYNTFWSLQPPFSRPPTFAQPETFSQFKEAVSKILPVIKEATAKDRAMMGSRSASANSQASSSTSPRVPAASVGAASSSPSGAKRKREGSAEGTGEETNLADYFFAKFLTSPDLLELEIADTHFRRQVLLQLLIVLNHLLSFTPEMKAQWCTPRNRSLQMDFTLVDESASASSTSTATATTGTSKTTAAPAAPAAAPITGPTGDLAWVKETINKVMDEMRATMPNGRVFAEVVSAVMEREKNWVRWKADLCVGFDKEPAYVEVDDPEAGLGEVKKRKITQFEATKEERRKMMGGEKDPKAWPYELGTEPLSSIWQLGYKSLWDLEMPFNPGEVNGYLLKVKRIDETIDKRVQSLMETQKRIAAERAKAEAEAAAEAEKEKAATTEKADGDKPKGDEDVVMESASDVPKITVEAPGEPASAAGGQSVATPTPVQPTPLHPSLPAKPGSVSATPSPAPTPAIAAPTPTQATAAAPTPTVKPASVSPVPKPVTPAPVLLKDPIIQKSEEAKSRLTWLALRAARETHFQHFAKIGMGDLSLLQQEIQKAKEEEEKKGKDGAEEKSEETEVKGEEPPPAKEKVSGGSAAVEGSEATQQEPTQAEGDADVKMQAEGEGEDVKMQESLTKEGPSASQATQVSLDTPMASMEGVSSL